MDEERYGLGPPISIEELVIIDCDSRHGRSVAHSASTETGSSDAIDAAGRRYGWPMREHVEPWWKSAVIYQVYPRSFADSDGDGYGDLPGLIGRLDYLAWLGVDGVWLSPFYPSPNVDWGYDVSDHKDVHPDFGSLEDFDRLIAEAHRRGLRVLVDFVMNHTSDQHPWFTESRSSTGNPKRDWYVWHGGDQPPNNWVSVFGGPAWERDDATGEWYYHCFAVEQPDLNWHNSEVREAMWDIMRFWADRGVDGFRLDAIATIFEAAGLPDHDASFRHIDLVNQRFEDGPDRFDWEELLGDQIRQPPIHALMRELRMVVDEYDDLIIVGEDDRLEFHGNGHDELPLVFNFPLMNEPLSPLFVKQNQEERLPLIPDGSWPCNATGSHDAGHAAARFTRRRDEWARIAATLVTLLKGTAVVYQGDEIGMIDSELLEIEAHTDLLGRWYHREAISQLGLEHDIATARAAAFSRDGCRTPMQWDSSNAGGFTTGDPWLPVHPNHKSDVSVAAQIEDPDSLLTWYRSLIALRHARPSIAWGDQAIVRVDRSVLIFERTTPGERTVVAINMAEAHETIDPSGAVLLSTSPDPTGDLAPFEVRVIASGT